MVIFNNMLKIQQQNKYFKNENGIDQEKQNDVYSAFISKGATKQSKDEHQQVIWIAKFSPPPFIQNESIPFLEQSVKKAVQAKPVEKEQVQLHETLSITPVPKATTEAQGHTESKNPSKPLEVI